MKRDSGRSIAEVRISSILFGSKAIGEKRDVR